MNSLFAIGLGLGVRVLVYTVGPENFRLGASIVGLCEGIILYNSRPIASPIDPTLNPYFAYLIRAAIDLLFTRNYSRMIIVFLFTGLGLVGSDFIEAASNEGPPPIQKTRASRQKRSRNIPSDYSSPLYDPTATRSPSDFSLPPGLPVSSLATPQPSERGLPVLLHSISSMSDTNSFLLEESSSSSLPVVESSDPDTPMLLSDPEAPAEVSPPVISDDEKGQ
jgi:hypothetical protein